MTVPGNLSSPLLATAADGAAAAAGPIKSLRFNSSDSATLTKTFSSAGNRKTWTWAGWVKKCVFTTSQAVFSATGFGTGLYINDTNLNGEIVVDFSTGSDNSTRTLRYTSRIFRDPSAWYHIVYAVDTTQATGSDRLKLYVNGEQQDLDNIVDGTWPTQNSEGHINNAVAHGIGYRINTSDYYFNGYLADVYFIDGSQLDPTSFGAFDSNGVWQAAAYTGTFGTNGFHLKFDDASSNAALGTDSSGNSNTFTVNNITAKASGKRGSVQNFEVVNYTGTNASKSIFLPFKPDFVWTKSKSRVDNHGIHDSVRGRAANLYSDDTYAENTSSASADLVSFDTNGYTLGTVEQTAMNRSTETYVAWCWNAGDNSNKTYTVKVVSDSGNKYRFDDFGTSAVTLDLAEGSTYVFDQSDSSNSGHPLRFSTTSDGTHNSGTEYTTGVTTTGTPGSAGAKTTIVVAASAPTLYYYCSSHSGMGGQANTNDSEGASNFDGSIQATVKANQEYGFSIIKFLGINNANPETIGHGLGAEPKCFWVKNRTDGEDWAVYHTGLGNTKYLQLNQTTAAQTSSSYWNDTTPTSSVITLNNHQDVQRINRNYVVYAWSEISGFSKFGTYTGGTGSQSITGLGFKPKFVMVKRTDSTSDWFMLDSTRGPDSTDQLYANLNVVEQGGPTISFDDDGFTFQSYTGSANTSGGSYIYMAFAATPPGENDDSLFDAPTNGTQTDSGVGSEVSGNYCTLNVQDRDRNNKIGVSNGNLEATGTSNQYGFVRGTLAAASGKYYFEATTDGLDGGSYGVVDANAPDVSAGSNPDYLVATAYRNYVYVYTSEFRVYIDGSLSYTGANVKSGDVIGVAVDVDAGKVWFSLNGVYQGSGTQDPANGTGGYSPTNLETACPIFQDGTGSAVPTGKFNFGQREFAFDAPSNFKTLCTTNLPAATIADGSDYFDTALWSGTGSAQSITGLGFSPDLVWGKRRSAAGDHILIDAVRGTDKYLRSNLSNAEGTLSTIITSLNSDGFTLGTATALNNSGTTNVGWAWDAGSSTASNTDGSITSSVRANQTAGFSIVTWTGNGTAGATVGHGLNAAPSLIITKDRDASKNWIVYHESVGATKILLLNANNAAATSDNYNDTDPTSSVFYNHAGSASYSSQQNINGNDYLSLCFAPVAGFSAFGSYSGTGGGSSSYFNYCGFRPRLVVVKRTDSTSQWSVYDTERSPENPAKKNVWWDTNELEYDSNVYKMDIYSNGFKMRNSHSERNASGGSYIWLAFAENPFQANGGLAR